MGWAKYYEDNMSIYIGRMAAREITPVFCDRSQIMNTPVAEAATPEDKKTDGVADKSGIAHKALGRKGLKVIFQNGADEGMIRKMQMNGWWWSKANACWYNQDTNGNRKYAKSLNEVGARVSVVL